MENKKIKICAITTIQKTMDWFLVDSMRNLSKNGYDITLICDMDDTFIEKNIDYAECIPISMSRGVSVKDLFAVTLKMRRIFKQKKFDIIYFTSPNASMYASFAGLLAGVKIRLYSQCGLRYVSFTGIKRLIFKTVEKLTCMFATHIRAQSPKNMQFAIDEGLCKSKKISVVGIGGTTGVDLAECRSFDAQEAKKELRHKYNIPNNAFLYGYVGRVNADKGINELIEAFRTITDNNPDVYLALVGMLDDTNPISPKNLDYAKNSRKIILTGNVPKDEVYHHMAMFDCLVHPTYREGFGKVLQEAMGMQLPIITTDVPGPSEVVENNVSGILCEVKNPDDLAEKMILLYKENDLRNSLAKAGFERATKYFDRPIMLNNILVDLNSVVKKRGKIREKNN